MFIGHLGNLGTKKSKNFHDIQKVLQSTPQGPPRALEDDPCTLESTLPKQCVTMSSNR